MAPESATRRLLMIWQAYIDDSWKPNGTFVLAGYIATAENWAHFAKEWDALLPSGGTLAKSGRYHFKMAEMATNPTRMERVPAFYWVIENHVQVALSVTTHPAWAGRAPAVWAAGSVIASRMAMRALRPLRRPVSTIEQRAA